MVNFEKIKMMYKLGRQLKISDVQVIINASTRKSFAPHEYLVSEGCIKKEIFFIRKGLVRTFVINAKGDEITTRLRCEHQFVASTDVILFDQPAKKYIEALEPTDTYVIDQDKLQSIVENNPGLSSNRKFVFRNHLKLTIQRIDSFVLLSPEERYLEFVQLNPDLINRVPNKYIANVLGITPVSLSRIRKRIASKNL